MKNINKKIKKTFNRKKFKYGGYAAGMTLGVIALVLVLNFLVAEIDSKFDLSVDLTANRVYSLTQQSEHILEELDQDIYIYTLFSAGYEDRTVAELIERYQGKSKFIHTKNIDMIKNPGIVSYFENEKDMVMSQRGVIVSTSADPTDPNQSFKMLDAYDVYGYDSETESFSLFTGEDAITGAIMFVLNPDIPKVWFLEGHGTTSDDWSEMRDYLEDENYDTAGLSLITNPDDLKKGDILIVFGPTIDLSDDEKEIVFDFATNGGKTMLIFNPAVTQQLPNLKQILSYYNLSIEEGLVFEDINNTSAYYYEPSYLVPQYTINNITSALKAGSLYMIVPYSGAIEIGAVQTGITITSLVESSSKSFLESNDADADYYKDEGAKEGPFVLAISVEKDKTQTTDEAQVIIVMSNYAFYNMSQMTAANDEFFINAVSWLNPVEDDFYIRGKSLMTSVLYFQTSGQILTVIIIVCGVIPLAAFIAGIVVFLKRRHL